MVRSQRIFTGSGSSQKLRLRSAPAPQHWVPVLHITRVVDPCHLCGSGSIFHSNRFWSKRFSSNFIKQKVNFFKLFKYLFIHYFLCFCRCKLQKLGPIQDPRIHDFVSTGTGMFPDPTKINWCDRIRIHNAGTYYIYLFILVGLFSVRA